MTLAIVSGPVGNSGRRPARTPRVAGVEIDYKFVGWVRQYEDGRWRAKLVDDDGYDDDVSYGTRQEAAEAVAARAAS